MSCSLADVLTFQKIMLLQSHYLLKVIKVALNDGGGRFLKKTLVNFYQITQHQVP